MKQLIFASLDYGIMQMNMHAIPKIFTNKIKSNLTRRQKLSLTSPRVALAATRAAAPDFTARGSSDTRPRSCRCRSSTPEARLETRMAGGKDLLASCGKHVLLAGFLPLLVDVLRISSSCRWEACPAAPGRWRRHLWCLRRGRGSPWWESGGFLHGFPWWGPGGRRLQRGSPWGTQRRDASRCRLGLQW